MKLLTRILLGNVSSSVHYIRSYLMPINIMGNVNLSHFPKMEFAKTLHCKHTISSFIITKYLGRDTFEIMKISYFFLNFLTCYTIYQQIFPMGDYYCGVLIDFSIFLIPSNTYILVFSVRNGCYFLWICSCIQLFMSLGTPRYLFYNPLLWLFILLLKLFQLWPF